MIQQRLQEDHFDERETWPVERWQRFQWSRTRAVLRYAYEHLPFYRRRLDAAGIRPEHVRTPADFAQIPLLQKSEILHAAQESGRYAIGIESAEPPGPRALGMTSGTLGTAFITFPAAWRRKLGDALARAYWWAGLRPGMRMMSVSLAWHSMAIQESRVIERLGARCIVPWGTFVPRFAGEYVDALLDHRPAFVSLFLPMLYALLAECRRRELDPARAFASVDSILVVGAPMTPLARQSLKDELGVRDIFEGAGNPEGLIAMECAEHRGHHPFIDACYVEIADPVTRQSLPPGQRGSVVVTSLVPHGSIHLRYDSDDVGEILPDPCLCGRTWPLLEIYDRRANRFHVQDRELLWYDVRQCLDRVPELIGTPFAVIRSPGAAPALRLAMQRPRRGEPDALERRVRELVATELEVPVRTEWVDELPVRWKGVTIIDEHEWEGRHG